MERNESTWQFIMKYAGILYDLHDIDVLRTKEHMYVTDRKKILTSFSKMVRKNSTFFEKLSKKKALFEKW